MTLRVGSEPGGGAAERGGLGAESEGRRVKAAGSHRAISQTATTRLRRFPVKWVELCKNYLRSQNTQLQAFTVLLYFFAEPLFRCESVLNETQEASCTRKPVDSLHYDLQFS